MLASVQTVVVLAVQSVVAVAAAGATVAAGAVPAEPVGLVVVVVHPPCWRMCVFLTLL